MRYLIFDVSNLLHKTFFAHNTEDDITVAGLASHAALTTMNKYYKQFKADKIIMAFDRPSWRIDYTKSDKCISGLLYKGERRKDQTPKQKERYALFKQHINDFETLIRENTSIITLVRDKLEADDLIAGAIQMITLNDPTDDVVLISADKDFMQLLRYDNVYLIDPATGNERTLAEHNNDANLFMFEKCFRGEGSTGDNVQSAYPRLRRNKIVEAYTDEFARTNLMNHEWVHPKSKKEFKVADLFEENRLLMDLENQPDDIQIKIIEAVQDGFNNSGEFSMFEFIKFCGKFDLKKVADGSDLYIKMLSL